MLLLAFDTSTAAITAAVHDGSGVVGEALAEGANAHGELLAPMMREALAAAGAAMADLTDVAVGVGPGPFTGLRVGVVTALTLGETLGLATHGVCSLDLIGATLTGEALVATDARRKEVYWARYVDGVRVDGPFVDHPEELARRHDDLAVHGPGATLYGGVLAAADGTPPRAAVLADLVATGRAAELPLEPLYLRRPDAQPR